MSGAGSDIADASGIRNTTQRTAARRGVARSGGGGRVPMLPGSGKTPVRSTGADPPPPPARAECEDAAVRRPRFDARHVVLGNVPVSVRIWASVTLEAVLDARVVHERGLLRRPARAGPKQSALVRIFGREGVRKRGLAAVLVPVDD